MVQFAQASSMAQKLLRLGRPGTTVTLLWGPGQKVVQVAA